ncbi:MAG: nucleotidyl transferase AbiEii/AbiGii toxin family protein [Candidatus Aminicenantes bacterium]|nr:nucleotidyl transferase AbiEii/AbiGii toxin family protein [Candidatus Aminicenantes bacterium]
MKNSSKNIFYQQADLLISVLPYVFKESNFAIHGGTAINFFIRDMPRISVDIDLIYQKILPRDDTLKNISDGLEAISNGIKSDIQGIKVEKKIRGDNLTSKLFVTRENALIKIEPNQIIRGNVFGTQDRDISPRAEEVFEKFVTSKIMSFEDVYGSKICAALDRQHPRDLFDIKLLMQNEGITEKTKKAFLVYLISNNRPIAELLEPHILDIKPLFEKEFTGMVANEVELDELLITRERLIRTINENISDNEKKFLVSFKEGEPKWDLLGVEGVSELPSIKWKLINIGKMSSSKHNEAITKLKKALKY